MNSKFLKIITIALFCGIGVLYSAAMTDQQVIAYVKQQMAAGKSKQQIALELKAQGVTEAQASRLMEKYNSGELTAEAQGYTTTSEASDNRLRGDQAPSRDDGYTAQEVAAHKQEAAAFEAANPTKGANVFGHDLFTSSNLTFAPSPNMATPKNYKLGPGDEVFIDIWGENEDHLTRTISPEGSIMISQIGPVYLNGLTIDQANNYLKQLLASKYSGMGEETQINLTLGNIRSITVDIMGEVKTPGTLTISPFSTVFAALYQAGGINSLGSIRNIQVMRDGRKISNIDLYDYIFRGKKSIDIRLQEGDVIVVPPSTTLVGINGNVKRPMYYEMLPSESVSKLIEYAGGFSGNAYSDMVTISRNDAQENVMLNVPSDSYGVFALQDGDEVTVGQVNSRYQNRIDLRGAVMRPGFYAIDKNINTIGKLIKQSEGLLEDAFTDRVLIYRQADDLSLEVIPVNLTGILAGSAQDVTLRRNDMIVVQSVNDIIERGPITVTGMVNIPGTYPYATNTTVTDAILMAGGLRQGASLVRADVARRVNDPYATQATSTIAMVYSFSIKDGYVVDGDKDFVLMPYDIVQIRTSPGYTPQQLVNVTGEVVFTGQYALEYTGERLSDMIRRSGGLTPNAYAKGASLIRTLTDDEMLARKQSLMLSQSTEEDSIAVSKLLTSNTYNVGIDLEAALANPGSTYDMVLRAGDVIHVPETQTTVKISGEVMSPTVTTYVPGKKAKYYVEMAGGYGERARKNKAFIVYMNGQVTKLKRNTEIEPGAQIIVPAKPKSDGTNWSQIVAITSGFASVATMAATIYNIFK